MEVETCIWTEDADHVWTASCEYARTFNPGGPNAMGWLFCPCCHKWLVTKPWDRNRNDDHDYRDDWE